MALLAVLGIGLILLGAWFADAYEGRSRFATVVGAIIELAGEILPLI